MIGKRLISRAFSFIGSFEGKQGNKQPYATRVSTIRCRSGVMAQLADHCEGSRGPCWLAYPFGTRKVRSTGGPCSSARGRASRRR